MLSNWKKLLGLVPTELMTIYIFQEIQGKFPDADNKIVFQESQEYEDRAG